MIALRPAGLTAFIVVSALVVGAASVGAHDGVREQIAVLTARLAQDPDNVEWLVRRAELYRLIEQWSAAVADLDRVERSRPNLPAANLTRARVLLDSGHADAASEAATRVIAQQPRHVEARLVRGRANAALHHDRAAIADFTVALEVQPAPDLYIERARLTARSKPAGLPEALAGLDEAIERFGPIVTLELEAIDLEIALGQFDSALARLDRVSRQAARQESWLARRGAILERAGRLDEALTAYRESLEAATAAQQLRSSRATAELIARVQRDILRLERRHAVRATFRG